MAVVGLYHLIVCALAVAGAAKLRDGRPFEAALAAVGVRAPRGTGGVAGVVEVVLAGAALLAGGWAVALAVAVVHLAFAAVGAVAMRRGAPTCGCFGARSARPSAIQLVANLAAAGVAVATGALAPDATVASVARELGWHALPYAGAVAVGAALLVAIHTTVVDWWEAVATATRGRAA